MGLVYSVFVCLLMQAQQQKTFNTVLHKQNNLHYGKNVYINNDGIPGPRNEIISKQKLEEEEEEGHDDEVF